MGPSRRPIRKRRSLSQYIDYMALMTKIIDVEPSNFEQATQQVWQISMVEEYKSIKKENVWQVVPRPEESEW